MKSLTRVSGGSTLTIAPGVVMSARTKGTGTHLRVRNDQGTITNEYVTASVATFIAGTTFLLVTPQDLSGAKYIRAETISGLLAHGTGAMLTLLSDDNGFDQGATLYVTESVATIQARIDAAVIAGGGGGGSSTFASVTAAGTNQATATATTTGKIRITGGAVNTGIVLDGATGGEEREIYNATTTLKFVYPAVGEFIDPGAANEPITLGPNEGIILSSNIATRWTRYESEDHQFVAATGTIQLGGQINIGVQDVTVASAGIGNTAVTLPAGTVGYKITVSNTTASNVRLYPFTGDAITGNGANNFINLQAGRQVELIMDVAGTWLFAQSQFETIAVTTIQPPVTTNPVIISDLLLGELARFANGGISFSRGVALFQQAGVATPGGNQGDGVQISANIFNIETCATLGDSATITAVSDLILVKNSGVASAYVYCPNGQTMDGVTDGFAAIPPGESYLFYQSIAASQWISMPLGEAAQSLTATPGGTQGTSVKVRGSVVTLATVATALDGATIDPTSGVKEFIIFNNAGVSASLFPPVGGTIDGGAANAAFVVPRSAAFILTTVNGLDYKVYLLPGATQVATANAGSTQATGTPVVGPFVNCTVVATAGDSYTIQNYSPRRFAIWNRDATESLDLFPNVGGTIAGGAVDAAFPIPAGVGFTVSSIDGSAWLVELLDGSAQSATASAGSDQATGTAITSTTVNATTVATAGDSYTIQAYSPRLFQIWNRDATESLDLFPPVGGTINGGGANAAFAIPAGVGFKVASNDGATWLVELLPGGAQVSTANVGSSQATGEPVVGSVECLVCANAGDAYSIQTWSPRFFHIRNSGANALDLFPPSGGQINGGGADVALSVAAAAAYLVYSNNGVLWYAILQ